MKSLVLLLSAILIAGIYFPSGVDAQCGSISTALPPLRLPYEQALYSLDDLEPITAQNAHRLQQVSLLGIGRIDYFNAGFELWWPRDFRMDWLPDGVTMVLPTTQGVFLNNLYQPQSPPYLLPNSLPSVTADVDPTGNSVLSMSADGSQMRLLSLTDHSLIAVAPLSPGRPEGRPTSPDPQFTPDGAFVIAMNGGETSDTFIWQRYTPDTLMLVDTLVESSLPITAYTLDPRLQYIGVVTREHTGYLLDIETGNPIIEFPGADSLLFSRDGERLFVETAASVQIWDRTPAIVRELSLAGSPVNSLAEANNILVVSYQTPDEERVYNNTLVLYDLSELPEEPYVTIDFSPYHLIFNGTGDRLAIDIDSAIDIPLLMQSGGSYEYPDVPGLVYTRLDYSQPISDSFSLREPLQLSFSSGCGWSPARPADGQTGEELPTEWPGDFYWDDLPENVSTHAVIPSVFAVSPDGSVVAGIVEPEQSGNASVVIYDLETGEALITLEHPFWNWLYYAEFRLDGKLLFVSTADESITVWGVLSEQ